MRDELDKKLCEKYPLIFRDRHGDMHNTCMCWGFAHGDGWYNIIDSMCARIQGHIDFSYKQIKWAQEWNGRVNDPDHEWTAIVAREERTVPEAVEQVVATQVKEKFGGLRFYYNGGDDYIRGVVDMAEEMSYCTCEVCGSPGKLRRTGWYHTLCDQHAKEAGYDTSDDEENL
jgi:hypothetical protein